MCAGWSGTFQILELKVLLSLCSTPPTTTKLFFVVAFGVLVNSSFNSRIKGEDFYFQRVLEPLVNYEHFKVQ